MTMNEPVTTTILVTGGTGTLGRHVVARLRDSGSDIRVLSRSDHETDDGVEFVRGDLSTGEGVGSAMQGAGVVLHLAGSNKGDDIKARHLVEAAKETGVRHLVYISVVGADKVRIASGLDRAMFGYFEGKLAGEQAVAESGIPWTTLRATQFHDLMFMAVSAMARLPVVPVPSGIRFQPVDTAEVADRLVELTVGPPEGLVDDIAGPRIYEMSDLVGSYLQALGKRRPILPVRLPGKAARSFRDGANLSPEHAVGRNTWEDFLGSRI